MSNPNNPQSDMNKDRTSQQQGSKSPAERDRDAQRQQDQTKKPSDKY